MEKTILTALNNFISEEIKTGKLEGHLFKAKNREGVWEPMDRPRVRNTWNEFEKLAKTNADNYDTILRDLRNICKGSNFDFTTKVSTKVSTFENYIKTLLILIDDKKYRLDGQGNLSKDGRALTLEGMIIDIKCRSNFVKFQKLGESMTASCAKLTIIREDRNKDAHADADTLKDFINGWFISTLIYGHIKNIAAGFALTIDTSKLKGNESIGVQILNGDKIIFDWTNQKIDTKLYIPIHKDNYNDEKTEINITIKVDYGFGNIRQVTIPVTKGQFDTDSKWREELNKDYEQGKDKIPLPDNIGSNKGFETIINNTNSLQQNQQSFNEYKADKKNGLYVEFGEFLKLIDEKVKVIDELPYKEDNTPDGNRKVIDSEVTKIRTELIYLRKEYKNEEDQKRFDEYKEDYKNKILKLRGSNKKSLELKENAKKDIEKQKYDKQKNLKENEENLKRIFDKLKDDLAKVGIWDDIKDWLNISFQWVDKHWQWCAGALCLIVIPVVLMSIFDGGNSVEISDGQAVPSLQGTWRVRLMEGQNVNEGATITQAGENNTQYNISIIRNDIPDDSPNMDYKFETALSVDWQKGIVTSPDLGEGTIEKESRSKNLKIVFDKWIFVSLKGY